MAKAKPNPAPPKAAPAPAGEKAADEPRGGVEALPAWRCTCGKFPELVVRAGDAGEARRLYGEALGVWAFAQEPAIAPAPDAAPPAAEPGIPTAPPAPEVPAAPPVPAAPAAPEATKA